MTFRIAIVFALLGLYHTANASFGSRSEAEDLLTTTQPSNGVLDDSMSDFNLESHLDSEGDEKVTKSSMQTAIEYLGFAFIITLLLVFVCCTILALILKTRAYIAKKFNK